MHRQRTRIDVNGNEIDPATKQVLKAANEGDYIPTNEERNAAMSKPEPTQEEIKAAHEEIKAGVIKPQTVDNSPKTGLDIEDMISKKIEALVEKKVNEVLEKLLK